MTYYSELIAAHKARRARLWAGPPKKAPEPGPVPAPPAAVRLVPGPVPPEESKPRPRTMRDLVRIVAEFYHVSPGDITSDRRFGPFIKPRQVAMYFGRKLLRLTTPVIGRELGRRDHTTVFYGIQKTTQRAATSWEFHAELLNLERIILGEWHEYPAELDARTGRRTAPSCGG